MTSRRRFLFAAVATCASLAKAQTAAPKRIHWMAKLDRYDGVSVYIRRAFAAQGLVEGRDVVVTFEWIPPEPGYGDGVSPKTAERHAQRIVGLRPDIIVTEAHDIVEFLPKLTRDIPIVFYNMGGLPEGFPGIESQRRPGGNVTGTTMAFDDMVPKFWELLKEFKPSMKRAGILLEREQRQNAPEAWRSKDFRQSNRGVAVETLARRDPVMNSRTSPDDTLLNLHKRAAVDLGMDILMVHTSSDATGKEIAQAIAKERVEGAWLATRTQGILDFVRTTRIPTVANDYHRLVKDGGAIAGLAWNLHEGEEYAVTVVKRVLQGEKPGTIPIYRMNNWRLELNVTAARRSGIEIPAAIRVRAQDIYN
jgi:putative ABC transport system substrate-binding protein